MMNISRPKRYRLGLFIVLVATIGVLCGAQVFGTGGGGSGGQTGACGSPLSWPCTTYGSGWIAYSRNGSGPWYFKNGTSWPSIQSTCSGAETVWVFGISNYYGQKVGYDYQSSYDNNSYGNSASTVHEQYVTAVNAGVHMNGSWGSTLGWFCWSESYRSVPPDVHPPATPNGSTTTASTVNDVTTLNNYDYKNKNLTFKHTVTVGTYLADVAASSARTKNNGKDIKPPEVAGSKSGSIAGNSWSVGGVSGNSSGFNITSNSGNIGSNQTVTVYNKTTSTLTGNNVGKNICQSVSASPSWSKRQINNINNSGYVVGWNVASSSGGSASSQACANVISNWTVNSTTGVNIKIAKPLDRIEFYHYLSNNDHVVKDDDGNWVTVTGTIQHGETNTASSIVSTSIPFAGPNTSFNFNAQAGESKSNSVTNSFTVSADGAEVGKRYCQYVSVNKPARNNNTAADGGADCVYTPYNYTTNTTITGADGPDDLFGGIEAGDTMTIGQTLRVDPIQGINPNAFYETKTPNVTVQIVCSKDGVVGGCAGWNVVTIEGSYISSKTGNIGDQHTWQVPANSPIGTKYCFQAKAVTNGYNQANGYTSNAGATESTLYCVTVIKSPTMQIHGAESWSGVNCPVQNQTNIGGFDSKQPSFTPGSVSATWSQYGLFSPGVIVNGFGSGGHIYNASSLTVLQNANKDKFSGDTTAIGGNYLSSNTQHCLTDILNYYNQRFAGKKDTASASLSDILNGSRPKVDIGDKVIWWGEGDKTLDVNGADLSDKNLIVVVDGNITITSDMVVYSNGNYASIANLPNLTVIASDDIIIDPSVTRLDGIYVANGVFYDCGLSLDKKSTDFSVDNVCSNSLTVNGAVITGSTRFQRTYRGINGVDDNIFNPTPAETISYPAAIWLQEYNYRKGLTSNMPVLFYREVAPRV